MQPKQFLLYLLALPLTLGSSPTIAADHIDLFNEMQDHIDRVHTALSSYQGGLMGLWSLYAALSGSRKTANEIQTLLESVTCDEQYSAWFRNNTIDIQGRYLDALNMARMKTAYGISALSIVQPLYEQDKALANMFYEKLQPEDAAAVGHIFQQIMDGYDAAFRALA